MKRLEEMNLTEKLGQMILTGLPGTEVDEAFAALVREEKIGNVILFQYNQQNAEQLRALCSSLRQMIENETGVTPLIASDEEGGVVSRLPEDMGKMPSAMALATLDDPEVVYEAALWSGQELLGVGINFVLAPVLDINNNLNNPVIGVRSYGMDAETVCKMGRAAICGYRDAGILCAGKHFPGHGDTAVDTHLDFALIQKGRAELKELELQPFEMAIQEQIPSIMAAHVAFAGEDGLPATLSRQVITGLLREEMGFEGLIVSDCMEMDAIRAHYGVADGVVRSVKAGVDLIGISRNLDDVRESLRALRAAVEDGSLPMERIDEAVTRILAAKEQYAGKTALWNPRLQRACVQKAENLYSKVVESGIQPTGGKMRLGKNPRFLSPIRQQMSLVTDKQKRLSMAEELAAQFGGEAGEVSIRPDQEETEQILHWAKQGSSIVVGCLNATIYPEQMALLQKLSELGLPMACAALRNPFELERLSESVLCVPLYEYSKRAVSQLAQRLLCDG